MSIIFILLSGFLWTVMETMRSTYWEHLPFHSTLETIDGLSSILIAVVLFNHKEHDKDIFFWIGNGFVCKGILDIFHAVCMPGESFIFLNSSASLSAAILFFFIWLPRPTLKRYAKENRWLTIGFIIISISVGFRAVLFPEGVPDLIPLYEDQFTIASITLKNLAAVLFLTAIPRWMTLYQESGQRYFLLFLFVSFLFGTSEIFFQYSDFWNGIWWGWHMIRLSANLITLWFLFNNYLKLNNEIQNLRNQKTPES